MIEFYLIQPVFLKSIRNPENLTEKYILQLPFSAFQYRMIYHGTSINKENLLQVYQNISVIQQHMRIFVFSDLFRYGDCL